ncbi:MAG: ribonuclease R family protein [Kiritimatiellia bacterium]
MKSIKKYAANHRERLLKLFQSAREPMDEGAVAAALSLRGAARKRLKLLLDEMTLQGEIVRLRQNRYSLGEPADLVPGQLDILRSGDALVRPSDNSREIFVPRGNLGTALPGDNVVVRLDSGAAVRRTGKVIRILERSRRAITGTLRSTNKFFYVVPIDPAYTQNFYVPETKGANVDDRVVIQITEWPNRHVSPEAEIIEVIGPSSDPSLDTLAIIKHYDLPQSFPADVLREAENAPALMDDPGPRRDLRQDFVFTVDPVTARDFDDALSLETDDAGRRVLGVHIADVAHFVQPGSALDEEAKLRGNSVYLPDKVLPMLPEQLSNGLCSLRPDSDRLAFSVWMTFDDRGQPVRADFARSIIRSRLRLTYEQCLEILQGKLPEACRTAGITPDQVARIRHIHKLAQQIRQLRFTRDHALELDVPEHEVIMGPAGMIVDIRRQENDISHQMIEECMVAANEAVDRELSAQGMAILRRVHEPPDPAKFEQLAAQLADMGLRPGDLSKRPNLAAFLKKLIGHPFEYDAKVAVLKSMKRAVYSPQALGHYGLAKKYYTHFTSPIRRYPDLVSHRVLAARLQRRRNPYNAGELETLGANCSRTEQVAEQAEKSLLEIKKYRFLEQQLAARKPVPYDAVVVHVRNFGMFVELVELRKSDTPSRSSRKGRNKVVKVAAPRPKTAPRADSRGKGRRGGRRRR